MTRPHRQLSPKLIAILAVLGIVGGVGVSHVLADVPDAALMHDARTLDAAPETTVTATVTFVPVDAVADPAGAAAEVRDYARGGKYAVVVFLVLLALARGLVHAVGKWPDAVGIRLLNTKLRRAILVASVGVLTAVVASLVSGVFDYQAIAGVIAAAAMLYMQPEPKPTAEDVTAPITKVAA